MSVSARSDETKVGMARCAVPATFSGGALRAQGHEGPVRFSIAPQFFKLLFVFPPKIAKNLAARRSIVMSSLV